MLSRCSFTTLAVSQQTFSWFNQTYDNVAQNVINRNRKWTYGGSSFGKDEYWKWCKL